MKSKIIIIILLFNFNISQSQVFKYEYNLSGQYLYNEEVKSYKFQENSYTENKSTVIVDETEKMIIVSRKFVPTNGDPQETYEKFYYVKKDINTNETIYYSVDLENKEYLEFVISKESTNIATNCSAFNNCKKVTSLRN